MKFVLQGPFRENLYSLMRKIGYHFIGSIEEKSELNFIHPLGGGSSYPRFHIYLKKEDSNLIFNLHLDQKKPIYKGTTAHSGEYDGELIKKEAKRIKQILQEIK